MTDFMTNSLSLSLFLTLLLSVTIFGNLRPAVYDSSILESFCSLTAMLNPCLILSQVKAKLRDFVSYSIAKTHILSLCWLKTQQQLVCAKQGGNGPIDQYARLRDIDEVDYTCFRDSLVSKWHTLQNVGNV